MSTEKTFTSKLGTTRAGARTRVWLEGSRLVAHGFACGSQFRKAWEEDRLVLTLLEGAHERSTDIATVSGKGAKPIIDITGTRVAEVFGAGTHVTVTYRAGRITIKRLEA